MGKAAHGLHLGQVLVALAQAVLPRGIQQGVPAIGLILGNHLLAAAGVAGDGVAGEIGRRGEKPRRHQGRNQGDEAAGVAARHGNALRFLHRRLIRRAQLREAISPVGRRAVGGGGVQQRHSAARKHVRCLDGRRVRQAQKRRVALFHGLPPRIGILSDSLGQGNQREIPPRRQALVDPQAGGAGAAVNKDALQALHLLSS